MLANVMKGVALLLIAGTGLARRANAETLLEHSAETRMQALIQRTRILVLASHSDALIKSMCNRAILLEKGRLIEIGPIDEVINRYRESRIESSVA